MDRLIQPEWWVALIAAILFAAIARAFRLLTVSGAIATAAVGFAAFGMGGGKFTIPLLTFFLTSSLLSRLGKRRKAIGGAKTPRGATRDYVQVLANSGAAAAIAVLFRLVGHRWPVDETRYLLMLYLAALATVNADTWATEIGGLSPTAPRLLSNWKPAQPGASGAITPLGLAAAVAGSLMVTGAGWLVWRLNSPEFLAVSCAGFCGSFIDSLLGASLQALYRHPVTGEPTERSRIDGIDAVKIRGLRWMNNDTVNFVASAGGVACAWALLYFCAYRA